MRKTRLVVLTVLLLAGVSILLVLPSQLKKMPTRYAMRLPELLQAWALPADPTPVLPTAAPPAGAAALLLPQGQGSAPAGTATPPPTPTALPVAGQDAPLGPTPTLAPTATAQPSPTPWPLPAQARMTGYTHYFQEWNNCGPATLSMALSHFGLYVNQTDTAAVLKPNPEDRNVSPEEMAAYVNEQTDFHAVARTNGSREILQRLLANNIPVIIELGIEPPGEYRWLGWYGHYLLPVAYDDALEQFWVYDSWFGTSDVPMENANAEGRTLTYADLDAEWPQFNRNYIVLYRPEEEAAVAGLLGDQLDDDTMWRDSLTRAQADASASPENPFYWFNLGTAYNEMGEYDKAAEAFDQARAIGLPWRMLWYQFGPYEAYFQVGRTDDVILLADAALQDRPYLEEAFYYKGLALEAKGDLAAARDNFKRAAEFNPNYDAARQALAAMESSGG